MDQRASDDRIRFGEYELDIDTLELRREGRLVDLAPMPARVLAILARKPDALVPREELYRELWPRGGVDVDRALNAHIRQIRRALGERGGENRFIRTHPGRGYRFVAETSDLGDPAAEPVPGWRSDIRRRTVWVAGATAVALLVYLAGPRTERPTALPAHTVSLASLDPDHRIDYLTGLELLEYPFPDRRVQAIPVLRTVTVAHPDFAPAHAALAEALTWADDAPAAEVAARTALALDPDDARALRALGTARLAGSWDWDEAEELLRRAVTMRPDDAASHVALAYLLVSAGRDSEARESLDRAADLEPTSPTVTGDIGTLYGWVGAHERARELCRRTVKIEPRAAWGHACLRRAEEALGLSPSSGASGAEAPVARTHLGRAVRLAERGHTRRALEALAMSARARESGFVAIAAIPGLEPLHGEPRFQELLAGLSGS